MQKKQCEKFGDDAEKCGLREQDGKCKLLQMDCNNARRGEDRKKRKRVKETDHKQTSIFAEQKAGEQDWWKGE